MTVDEWAREAARRLVDAGLTIVEARQDAGVIGRHVLGWDAARWIVQDQRRLGDAQRRALDELIARRTQREPVAYLLGGREFFGRDFRVTPAVLIPRPETELLVAAGLAFAREAIARGVSTPHLLDVGTGSGCVAVTLALEIPQARITATDISAEALDVARDNAHRHGVSGRITFVQASLAAGLCQNVDVLVSNPPYVALDDRDRLQPDVRDYEPAVALYGGADGLEVIEALAAGAELAIVPGGPLAMEIGAGQHDAVQERLERAGFERIGFSADLAGHVRIVTARKRASV